MFWGPYLIRSQSRNAPTFVVRHGGELYRRLMWHFDTIWADDNLSRNPTPEDALPEDGEV